VDNEAIKWALAPQCTKRGAGASSEGCMFYGNMVLIRPTFYYLWRLPTPSRLFSLLRLAKELFMSKGRLEAFSDGVLAIIITIMVLELKVPHGSDWETLFAQYPKFISYLISFVYIAIYWNNHHHVFQAVRRINGRVLWANMGLLFTLSLFPFATGWMGENHFAALPISVFSFILLISSFSFSILMREIVKIQDKDSILHESQQKNKTIITNIIYFLGVVTPFFSTTVGLICAVIPGIMWLIPHSNIEKSLADS